MLAYVWHLVVVLKCRKLSSLHFTLMSGIVLWNDTDACTEILLVANHLMTVSMISELCVNLCYLLLSHGVVILEIIGLVA